MKCDRCGDDLSKRVRFEMAIYAEAIAHYPGGKQVGKEPISKALTLCQGCFLAVRDRCKELGEKIYGW